MKAFRFLNTVDLSFFCSVTFIYSVTLLLVCLGITPYLPHARASVLHSQATYSNQILTKKQKPAKKIISGNPVYINIPKLDLSKEIQPGIYNESSKTWSISPSGVHYAQFSSKINDSAGNTLLYAHNNKWAFGLLYLLKPGDKVSVKTDTGYQFTYVLKNADDYDPSDTDLFSYSGPPVLTLQTCSGIFNEYRRLYSFHLNNVEKI